MGRAKTDLLLEERRTLHLDPQAVGGRRGFEGVASKPHLHSATFPLTSHSSSSKPRLPIMPLPMGPSIQIHESVGDIFIQTTTAPLPIQMSLLSAVTPSLPAGSALPVLLPS